MSTADLTSQLGSPPGVPDLPPGDLSTEAQDSAVWRVLSEMPAWGISFGVHIAILLILASITFVTQIDADLSFTSAFTEEIEEIQQEEFVIDTEVTDEVGSMSQMNILGPSLAAAQSSGVDTHLEQIERFEQQIVKVEVPNFDRLPTPSEAEVLLPVDLTGTTEHVGGTEGAIERITAEIAASLRERKTLVVWLFDESLSLEDRRTTISDRFEKIYTQLGAMDAERNNSLYTGIVGYGAKVHVLQGEATGDFDKLQQVVRSIENDASGVENVFSGVNQCLQTFSPQARKLDAHMMLVIVTDERGDDYAQLEETVRRCSRAGVRVYSIGNAAIFGREKGLINYEFEFEGEMVSRELPVDQGPETAAPEALQLPFWTAENRGLDRMSSSYGPYTLARLSAETGGIFLLAEESRGRHFDEAIMRRYAPDYRPIPEYIQQLSQNKAKAALHNAAQIDFTADIPIPQLRFQADNDNILRQEITEAQKPMSNVDFFFQPIQAALEQGERDRDSLDSDRWRASYDLAMGRILAMRVRAYGYNVVLAEMKTTPKTFERKGSNTWRLDPADDLDAGPELRKMKKKAIEYLTRVVDEHPGTPWAFLAEAELSAPIGWKWVEMEIPRPTGEQMAGNNANRPQFAPEEEQRRREAQERRRRIDANLPKL